MGRACSTHGGDEECMPQNRVLRRIFGSKRDEVIGGWGKLHNEELHNLYCWSSTIRIIKSRRIR
jgi:hypothetical protein